MAAWAVCPCRLIRLSYHTGHAQQAYDGICASRGPEGPKGGRMTIVRVIKLR
jgi:hypothetical protein